jgi:lysyl-tRNA synthetase class 2
MNQIAHIKQNKDNLILRSKIIKLIRNFFEQEGFLELDPPTILKYPDSEPHLTPIAVQIQNEQQNKYTAYLHTSPEYTLKKALAGGFQKIFAITHCFRNNESFGGTHNPEFTMIEWYRTNENFEKIMDDSEKLFKFISKETKISRIDKVNLNKKWERFSMKKLWKKYVNVNLDDYLENKKMFELCIKLGFNPKKDETFEDLFYRIFLNLIEPHLGKKVPTIIYEYPKQMAALSKISEKNPNYAERFEIYINGIELANAFTELTDAKEQTKRIENDEKTRENNNKSTFGIDKDFLQAVEQMPKCAGIALGVDRLVMLFANCKNIENVLLLPMSKIMNT